MKMIIQTDKAPAAIGAYSQAVLVENSASKTLYFSGQLGLDPETLELVSDAFLPQAEQVMSNIAAVLEAAKMDWTQVVKLNVYVTDLSHFAALNELFPAVLSEPFPARAVVEVSALPKGALVEIDGVACG